MEIQRLGALCLTVANMYEDHSFKSRGERLGRESLPDPKATQGAPWEGQEDEMLEEQLPRHFSFCPYVI